MVCFFTRHLYFLLKEMFVINHKNNIMKMTEEVMEETIDLRELYQILKKRLGLIFVIAFLATVASGIISFFFITPTYQVSTQLVVSNSSGENQVSTTDIQSSLQLINTYSDILTSPAILDIVVEELGLNSTASQLRGQMTVNTSTNSQVIGLSVRGTDPNLAADIANKTATVFQEEIGHIMSVDNVSILAPAEVAENISPINPRPMLNMAIALVVGIMIGVGIAFLLEYLDKTVKTEQEVENLLELPILGSIPVMTAADLEGNSHRKSYYSK